MNQINGPRLIPRLWVLLAMVSVIGTVATLVAFLLSGASTYTRVAVAACIVLSPIVACAVVFSVRWTFVFFGRLHQYNRVFAAFMDESRELAATKALIARTFGTSIVRQAKIIRGSSDVKLIFNPPQVDCPKINDALLLIDEIGLRPVARAIVTESTDLQVTAVVQRLYDSVAVGWVHETGQPLGELIPQETFLVSERAVADTVHRYGAELEGGKAT